MNARILLSSTAAAIAVLGSHDAVGTAPLAGIRDPYAYPTITWPAERQATPYRFRDTKSPPLTRQEKARRRRALRAQRRRAR